MVFRALAHRSSGQKASCENHCRPQNLEIRSGYIITMLEVTKNNI
jgi:hypothetical protein